MLESTVLGAIVQALTKAVIDRVLPNRTPPAPVDSYPAGSEVMSAYAVETGQRIHYVRDQLLGLSKRQLCELLDISSVAQLERYEAGIEEFPLALTRTFEGLFNVTADYMDGRSACVFRQFELCTDTAKQYLAQGYTPVIICNPCEREDLFCRITFERHDKAFVEMHVGSLLCSFASSGGGMINIHHLINAMLDLGLGARNVRIVRVTDIAWSSLMYSRYHATTAQINQRFTDFECQEVWAQWFADSVQSRKRFGASSRGALALV
jgi:hypothetical protein